MSETMGICQIDHDDSWYVFTIMMILFMSPNVSVRKDLSCGEAKSLICRPTLDYCLDKLPTN